MNNNSLMKNNRILKSLLILLLGATLNFAHAAGPEAGGNTSFFGTDKTGQSPTTFEAESFDGSSFDGEPLTEHDLGSEIPVFPEEQTTEVPLDGGASLLLLAGAGIAVRSLRRKEKK